MDEQTIREYMYRSEVTASLFINVLSFEELPQSFPYKQGFYIINADYVDSVGTHWFVVYQPLDGPIEFFDSLGKDPRYYNEKLYFFLCRSSKYFVKINKRIQGNTNVCGDYCLLYCYFRSKGYSMLDFLNIFGSDLNFNDKMVQL